MFAGVVKLWTTIGALGVTNQTAHERRRIAVLNHALSLGIIATVGYAVMYTVMDALTAAVINVCFVVLYSASLLANYRGKYALARHVSILGANVHMFALSVFVLGVDSGVHRWYWMFIVLTFLVFTRSEKLSIYFYSALSIGLFTSIEHGLMDFGPNPVISARTASILNVTSTIVTLVVITLIVDFFDRETGRAENALSLEHKRSESLLLNILPETVAERLKDGDEPIADSFREVTVLFADIEEFTTMSNKMSPEDLVDLLNLVFSDFDKLADNYGLEKIKTIGDAYMVAGGLPEPMNESASAVAHMALDMVEVARRRTRPNGESLNLRIGINTGPVVAGVIGTKKFIYDLWGDTVNTASRMESHGRPGEIQVTEDTYELIKDDFDLEERGTIDVKGKGQLRTFFLKKRKKPQRLISLAPS